MEKSANPPLHSSRALWKQARENEGIWLEVRQVVTRTVFKVILMTDRVVKLFNDWGMKPKR